MNVVHVIPIQRGIGIEELTYFTIRDVSAGSLVTVPLRGSLCPALVVSVEGVQDMKTHLKTQNFQLKKMGPDAPRQIFPEHITESARAIANFYATTTGAVLFSLLPKAIMEKYATLPTLTVAQEKGPKQMLRRYALQCDFAERCVTYKNIARESLAKRESVFFLVPQQSLGEQLAKEIERGIEKHVTIVHSGMTKKKIATLWQSIAEKTDPVILIGTAQFLTMPHHFTTIVIDSEGEDSYVRVERPYLDMRVVAEIIAESTGARIIYGDTMLRAQTYAELESGIVEPYAPLQQKLRGNVTTKIISKPVDAPKRIFSPELESKIQECNTLSVHTAFLVARKNIATSVICADCGTRCVCTHCGGPQRLSTRIRTDERILVCARCGVSESANVTCKKCNGWKLKMYGVTTESVARELSALIPNAEIHVFEASKGSKTELLQKLQKGKRHLFVVGTTALRPHLSEFHTVIVPSLEGFLSAPTYTADEDTVRLMASVREQVHQELVIQTTQPVDVPLITQLRDGELTPFLRDELALRKSLHLPPYATEITITISGKRELVVLQVKEMLTKLQQWKPRPHKELTRVSSVSVSHETKLYIPRSSWPSTILIEQLRSLPQQFSIKIS